MSCLCHFYALAYNRSKDYYIAYVKIEERLDFGYYLVRYIKKDGDSHYEVIHLREMKKWRFFKNENDWIKNSRDRIKLI